MEIGSFEAKNKLSALLERAERGEEIVITRRGQPVARLVPYHAARGREAAAAAAQRIRERAKAISADAFDWESWKALRDEAALSIVIDASVTLAWIFADEQSELAQAILAEVVQAGAVVPSIWPLEVANVLLLGVRRGRLTAAQRDSLLADLAELDIEMDDETAAHAWRETLGIGERFNLTVYDAAYLELAHRRDMPIATLDRALAAAADGLGLTRL